MAEAQNLDQQPRPHAVMIPVPAQGHVNPMLKLAKLLHNRGFHITFVNTDFNHRRLLKSRGASFLRGLKTFNYASIPDGMPLSNEDATQDPAQLALAIDTKFLAPFRSLVHRINEESASSDNIISPPPPVTCIVSDAVLSFTLEIAEELCIPNVQFWTPSACGVLSYAYTLKVIENGLVPQKDNLANGYLDTTINWIPGMEGIRLKDLSTIFHTTDQNDVLVHFNKNATQKSHKGSAIILNTFDDLEPEVLKELLSMFPKLLTIGPLQLLEKQDQDSKMNSFELNLWTEDATCLEWLDSRASGSVLLVNFGSIARMTKQQLIEFACGLANSKQNFLWVIRPDLVVGDSTDFLSEFEAEIKGRAKLASWCPQEKVLSHPAVGGFLTHCGWNSMLESICSGVPMLCWPAYAEQPTNSWFCCKKWGVGLEIGVDVKRDEVERLVREVICGQKGKEMKGKAMEWKKKAEESCSTGSSCINFEKMVKVLLSSIS
ncbi:hypothetical protein ACH5RR_034595 [Cinchona calisaya]|uniref:Glycosyltransferase n=1 Tax=Cinchona calisaya TaxID=153742 RepID=A0ABD2YEV3_9GENT